LIGGLAVAARAEPRTTRDVDVAVSVADDGEAEQVVAALLRRGYRLFAQLEHTDTDRLGGVRLVSPAEREEGLVADLLFASSGIESEVVEEAETLEIMPGLAVPVARTGHLIALKVLAFQPEYPDRRPHDVHDARALIAVADDSELERARRGLAMIRDRGYARGRDLDRALENLLARRTDPLE
jgi:predicted nucleotidyltransferase